VIGGMRTDAGGRQRADGGLRIAVVGGGIAGLAAAHRLAPRHRVTLFEANDYVGGHTNTVDVTVDGACHPVDTGFLVFNERTYPNLIRLFAELDVPVAKSEMSFSVSVSPGDFEWCGSSLASLFAQPSNAASPRFWSMLADILRFNRQATALALSRVAGRRDDDGATALGEWLDRHRYGRAFRELYLLPMAAAIWSCPMRQMLAFPVGTFAIFCHNHGLLQVTDRPQWYTVRGGARRYVERILEGLDDVRRGTPVRAVIAAPDDGSGEPTAGAGPATVVTDAGAETFDQVVLACHSDQALKILARPTEAQRRLLSAVPYQRNVAYLHTDTALMPRRRRAWAAWNHLSDGTADAPQVAVTYWLNRLQPLPFETPVLVTLNPSSPPREERTIAAFDYSHPAFDLGAIDAQQRLPAIQGDGGVWFAGAWTGYGFHEDGLKSGFAVAAGIDAAHARAPSLERRPLAAAA
jgi:uncharacterized protein